MKDALKTLESMAYLIETEIGRLALGAAADEDQLRLKQAKLMAIELGIYISEIRGDQK